MPTTYQLIVQEPIPVGTYIVTLAPAGPVTPDVPRGTVFAAGKLSADNTSWGSAVSLSDAITVTITKAWGGFQARGSWDLSKFTALNYRVKPSRAQTFSTGFHSADGSENGIVVVSPAVAAGQWNEVSLPLAQFKMASPLVAQFSIADNSGAAINSYQLDLIGFS